MSETSDLAQSLTDPTAPPTITAQTTTIGAPYAANNVQVLIGSDLVAVPWLQTYTAASPPAYGDEVVLVLNQGSPLILGKRADIPLTPGS